MIFSNSRFFVNYGFSLETNDANEALMTFKLTPNDKQNGVKAKQFGFNAVEDDEKREFSKSFQIPMDYNSQKVKAAFSFLRIKHGQVSDLPISPISFELKIEDTPPISIKNERNVLISLAAAATKSLNKFETTLYFDNESLKKGKLSLHRRNSVLMRRGEKEVLQFYIDLQQICLPLFEISNFELQIKLMKEENAFKDNDSPLMQYINQVVLPLVQNNDKNPNIDFLFQSAIDQISFN